MIQTTDTELRGHSDWVRSAQFSPDGQRIVTTSEDQTARLWNHKGEELAVLTD
ncbi:WD40 repeat domain-containing protein [Spirulina subsalsa]|uniref:WD40 repeat domain-containing protein n=1 Tax=Spirulina subsalsa TaxID=54311 RepID=UPI000314C27C|nr:WD40 repeat domain-containing protein [Spirulina subsalsa]